ncbi:hypothetical protein [Paraburkholderia sp. JPY465]|uniref:hypothetical protein n=1 Tax=Paraburkholderia sp. JPY465 TaxID=3042285 RepID=UPI003D20C996
MTADIAPLEAFAVPPGLDGSAGSNRAPFPAEGSEFRSDIEAIHAWIRVRGVNSEHTARAYRREAERLLLWAVVARGKAFSSLSVSDVDTYLNGFLADPQPAGRWIGRAKAERFDPAWRPFTGPLPVSSRETARKVLSALCAWLVKVRYLLANPFDALPRLQVARPEVDTHGRTLTHAQQRDAFALLFAYATGLRRAELARATLAALDRKGRRHARRCVDAQGQGKGREGPVRADASEADGRAARPAAADARRSADARLRPARTAAAGKHDHRPADDG